MSTADLRKHLAAGGGALFDLSGRAKFTLTGADRVRYLNGQVSNDVRRLEPVAGSAALSACVMNAKGKMNAFIWMSAGPDQLRIDADPGQDLEEFREALAARLERYIISDDAALADTTDEVGLFHLLGLPPEKVAALPEGVEWHRSKRYGVEGIDLFGDAALLSDAMAVLPEKGGLRVDAETEESFRIEQGIPRWGAELDENTLPAEAGLDVSAIDFHKGCYIGQEIISRIKSVGRVNRRLCGFVAEAALVPGAPLLDDGKEVGMVTSAAWSFALDKAVALGYLKRGVESLRLTVGVEGGSPDGSPEVEVRRLPLID